jgi:hypothetical protein
MNPITHFLASWASADAAGLEGRDRALVSLCGVAPDLDGLGVVVDGANHLLGRPDSWYFGQYHHALLHGLPAAILIPGVATLFARNRLRAFVMGCGVVHLHFLCDLLGSRGPGVDDLWPLPYLAPFSNRVTFQWAGQWPVNAWPNIAFTVALIAYSFYRAVKSGYSPVGVFSAAGDRAFVAAVQQRWRTFSREGRSREA